MSRVFFDRDTGMMWPEEIYKEGYVSSGATEEEYAAHVKEIEAKGNEEYQHTIDEVRNTKWEDPGPLTREKMAECFDNIFGDYSGMPGILKDAAKDFRSCMLGHFKSKDEIDEDT